MSVALDAHQADPLAVRLLYSPHDPTPQQHAFYLLDELEVLEAFYGGAAGGGKSDALLTAALRYVDVPGYAALILRKTFADLDLPGAIMSRAREWLAGTDAKWSERAFRFTFPSGASLSFGYLQTSTDRYRYQGAEFQFIGWDELTQFDEEDYRYLFTRLRRPELYDAHGNPLPLTPAVRRQRERLSRLPLRMRSASNPGGRGHLWVRRRLVERLPAERRDDQPPDPMDTPERAARRVFIPAKLRDNPHVDRATYEESLAAVDEYTRAQMLAGDWYAQQPGAWVYDARGIAAAALLGEELDEALRAGEAPPPVGGLLAIGIDWGEHMAALLGWPLEGGGLWVCHAVAADSLEPGAAAVAVRNMLADLYELAGATRGPGHAPALPRVAEPLTLVSGHRYDAAGIQSMRTYMAATRRRHPTARSVKVPFGAPAPRSGAAAKPRSYKAEAIAYTRRLLGRSLWGATVYDADDFNPLDPPPPPDPPNRVWRGALAISPRRASEYVRQLRALEWLDREAGTVKKGDDHTHDAGVALIAPLAIRHR